MSAEPKCPKCECEFVYAEANLWTCPECAHEWTTQESAAEKAAEPVAAEGGVKDAFGNVLVSGDSVTVIKELKVKGSSSVVKVGTKVKKIRVIESEDGHNIGCKIDGIGAMNLKSEFVKKA
jgi:protein PhnA